MAVFCIALVAVSAILIHMGKARSDFRKLSQMVQENATAVPAETTPPETQSTQPAEETTAPTEPEPTEPVMLAKYAPLYEKNHDLFGWLRIDGTAIDYPVMHTPPTRKNISTRILPGNTASAAFPSSTPTARQAATTC